MLETVAAGGGYRLDRVSLDEVDRAGVSALQSPRARWPCDGPMQNPEWLQGFFAGQTNNLTAYCVYRAGSLCGEASFLWKEWPLNWQLGELNVARLPLRRLRLLGGTLNLPEDEAAYDTIFGELADRKHRFDAVHLEEVPLDSFLWKYLQTSALIGRSFRRYVPEPPSRHLLIRLRGSFDDYMKKFSAKHRHVLRWEVRRIKAGALGPMRFVQYTRPEEIPAFLEPAVAISRKTYQWALHRRGLSRTDLLRERMQFAAEHNWLRSYLLFCGDRPSAFVLGFQFGGVFLPHEIGFDPELAKYSVGTVLQLLVVEDLFAQNSPEILDLGCYGTWKEVLSNDSYLESKVLLFRPGAYTRFVQAGHHACNVITKYTASALDRLQRKSALKRAIRAWKAASGEGP